MDYFASSASPGTDHIPSPLRSASVSSSHSTISTTSSNPHSPTSTSDPLSPIRDDSLLPSLRHLMLRESQDFSVSISSPPSDAADRPSTAGRIEEYALSPTGWSSSAEHHRGSSTSIHSLLNLGAHSVDPLSGKPHHRTPTKPRPLSRVASSPNLTPKASQDGRFTRLMMPPTTLPRRFSDDEMSAGSSSSSMHSAGARASFAHDESSLDPSFSPSMNFPLLPPPPRLSRAASYSNLGQSNHPYQTAPPHLHHSPSYPTTSLPSNNSRTPISRTTKACNACRARKVRCDAGGAAAAFAGEEVTCSRCKEGGVSCVYSGQQRKRGPTPGSGSGKTRRKPSGVVRGSIAEGMVDDRTPMPSYNSRMPSGVEYNMGSSARSSMSDAPQPRTPPEEHGASSFTHRPSSSGGRVASYYAPPSAMDMDDRSKFASGMDYRLPPHDTPDLGRPQSARTNSSISESSLPMTPATPQFAEYYGGVSRSSIQGYSLPPQQQQQQQVKPVYQGHSGGSSISGWSGGEGGQGERPGGFSLPPLRFAVEGARYSGFQR